MIKQLYRYKGFRDCDSECLLQINNNVVIVTELDDNIGTSITNMAESLFTKVVNEFGLKAERVVWFEDYIIAEKHSCSLVEFDAEIIDGKVVASNPSWTSVGYDRVMKVFHGEESD